VKKSTKRSGHPMTLWLHKPDFLLLKAKAVEWGLSRTAVLVRLIRESEGKKLKVTS
jgi:hypothetical protein